MTPKTITEKTNLHPRNQHRFRYDFELLIKNSPELKSHVSINEHSIETIDFSDPGL
jgi:23S rRNA (adenine1618-N6)-methyltransferase